jgi:hypothetical protein
MGADDMKARTPAPEGEAWRHVSQEEMAQAAKFASTNLASPVVPVGVREVLDAAAAYLKEQYGASHGLDHPVDRARILAALRPTDTGANHD